MQKIVFIAFGFAVLAGFSSLERVTRADEIFPTVASLEFTVLRSIPQARLPKKAPTVTVTVTAYSSTPEETDDTPFITAANTHVRDGIIAANFLPFGTKVKIPSLFGDKVFVVEDRMHPKKKNFIDIWMPSKYEAIQFGKHRTEIAVLN